LITLSAVSCSWCRRSSSEWRPCRRRRRQR
jgi:hypothetical protein